MFWIYINFDFLDSKLSNVCNANIVYTRFKFDVVV